MVPVPDRFENRVGKPGAHQILDHLILKTNNDGMQRKVRLCFLKKFLEGLRLNRFDRKEARFELFVNSTDEFYH